MDICTYVYMYICTYMYIYICMYVYMYVYVYMCICVYVYMCMYVYIYIFTYIHSFIHTYIHMYIDTHVYTSYLPNIAASCAHARHDQRNGTGPIFNRNIIPIWTEYPVVMKRGNGHFYDIECL